jgi:hypothetical protein
LRPSVYVICIDVDDYVVYVSAFHFRENLKHTFSLLEHWLRETRGGKS